MTKEVKAVFRLTSDNIAQKANEIVSILRTHSPADPCSCPVLMEGTGLTKGQVSTVIKYMRRCAEKDLEKYIPYYPISSKRGYYLPTKWDDFARCYATLEMWIASLTRTIRPMRTKMIKEGVDWRKYIILSENPEEYSSWLEDIPEQNKETSWFLDQ